MYEDEGFRSRQFAALVASKVFYHLGAFEESLNYALGAGDLFNVNDNSEYVETIIGNYFLSGKALFWLFSCCSAYNIFFLNYFLLLPNLILIGSSQSYNLMQAEFLDLPSNFVIFFFFWHNKQ